MRYGQGGPSREQIEPYVESGHVRSQTNGPLTIYSYTDLCVYERKWDDVTMACRGLILDNASGGRVAAPFIKFFNLGEPSCPPLPSEPYEVFGKMDGSLIIAYFYAGEWHFSTRGSFDNIYIDYANRFKPWLYPMDVAYTHMFEVVLPKGKDQLSRPVPHRDGLYYLGSVFTDTWSDAHPRGRHYEAWSGPCSPQITESIDELMRQAEDTEGTEGWVVRYQNGFRVKIKTAWYLRLFRAISNLSEKKLRELLAESFDPDKILMEFPEELRPDAEAMLFPLFRNVKKEWSSIVLDFTRISVLYPTARSDRSARKDFALHIKDLPKKHLYFKLLEGKDILRDLILQE